MDAGPKSAWKDMANIYLRPCADSEVAQKWIAMADGRIALEASPGTRKYSERNDMNSVMNWTDDGIEECIDLQYLRATQNNPVGLYDCAGLQNSGAADKGINWLLMNATMAMKFVV
jgi:hypothetical protein